MYLLNELRVQVATVDLVQRTDGDAGKLEHVLVLHSHRRDYALFQVVVVDL